MESFTEIIANLGIDGLFGEFFQADERGLGGKQPCFYPDGER